MAAHEFAIKAGLKSDTVDYFKYCDDALEMYSKSYNGTRFDPSEKVPHPNEVCHMLGLSYDEYNKQHRKMYVKAATATRRQGSNGRRRLADYA